MPVKKLTVADLVPDDKNFNKGNEYGESLIEKSFNKFGAGRGILVDKNNRIIAGNKSTQKFVEGGNEKIIVVETTGDTLVVTKRTDIDLDTPQGREMALADNMAASKNITMDAELIEAELSEAVLVEWGVENYAKGSPLNSMNENDLDLDEEFNPIGKSDGMQRVVFLFNTKAEAESYLNSAKIPFVKRNMAWQVNMSSQSTL